MNQWISVKDRLPNKDQGEVLVFTPACEYGKIHFNQWRMQREAPLSFSSATVEIGESWDDFEFEEVTHWMPLPAPPVERVFDMVGARPETFWRFNRIKIAWLVLIGKLDALDWQY